MNKYREYKKLWEKEINAFPMMFAFSKKQFAEGLQKLAVSVEEVISIGAGGFIRLSDKEAFETLVDSLDEKLKTSLEDDEFVFQMFEYELGNHEYCISGNNEEVLRACGLGIESLNDERLNKLYKQAKKSYLRGCR